MKKISFIKNMMMTSAVALSLFSNSVIANPSDADVEAYLKGLSVFSLTTPEDRAVYTTFSDERWEDFKKFTHDFVINSAFRSERLAVLAAIATLPDEKLNDAFLNQLVRFARYMGDWFVKDAIRLINALGHVPEKDYAPLESRLKMLTNAVFPVDKKDVITVIEALASCPPESYDKLFDWTQLITSNVKIKDYSKVVIPVLKKIHSRPSIIEDAQFPRKIDRFLQLVLMKKDYDSGRNSNLLKNAMDAVEGFGENYDTCEKFLDTVFEEVDAGFSEDDLDCEEAQDDRLYAASAVSNLPVNIYPQFLDYVKSFEAEYILQNVAKYPEYSPTYIFQLVAIAGIEPFKKFMEEIKERCGELAKNTYYIVAKFSYLPVRTPEQFSQFQTCFRKFLKAYGDITSETVCDLFGSFSQVEFREGFDIAKIQNRIKNFMEERGITDSTPSPLPAEESPDHLASLLGRFKSDENIETHRLLMEIPENHMARFDQLMHSVLNIDEMNERQRETVWRSIRKIPSKHLFNTLPVLLTDILGFNTKPGDLNYIEPEERAEIVQSVSAFVPHLKWVIMSGHSQHERFLILHDTDVTAVKDFFRKVLTVWKNGTAYSPIEDEVYSKILNAPENDLYPVFMEVLRGMRTQGRQIFRNTGTHDLFSGDFGQRVLASLPLAARWSESEFLPCLRICMNAAKKGTLTQDVIDTYNFLNSLVPFEIKSRHIECFKVLCEMDPVKRQALRVQKIVDGVPVLVDGKPVYEPDATLAQFIEIKSERPEFAGLAGRVAPVMLSLLSETDRKDWHLLPAMLGELGKRAKRWHMSASEYLGYVAGEEAAAKAEAEAKAVSSKRPRPVPTAAATSDDKEEACAGAGDIRLSKRSRRDPGDGEE